MFFLSYTEICMTLVSISGYHYCFLSILEIPFPRRETVGKLMNTLNFLNTIKQQLIIKLAVLRKKMLFESDQSKSLNIEEIMGEIEFLKCSQMATKDIQSKGFHPLNQHIRQDQKIQQGYQNLIDHFYKPLTPDYSRCKDSLPQNEKKSQKLQRRVKTSFYKFLLRLIRRILLKYPEQFDFSIWPQYMKNTLKSHIRAYDYQQIIRQNYTLKIKQIFQILSNNEIIELYCIMNKKMAKRMKVAIMTQIKLYRLRCRNPSLSLRARQSYCKAENLINYHQLKAITLNEADNINSENDE